jgi:hypothetical protein
MAKHRKPSPTPEDATEVTEEQAEMQQQLDDQHHDPEGPGLQQDRHQIADET